MGDGLTEDVVSSGSGLGLELGGVLGSCKVALASGVATVSLELTEAFGVTSLGLQALSVIAIPASTTRRILK